MQRWANISNKVDEQRSPVFIQRVSISWPPRARVWQPRRNAFALRQPKRMILNWNFFTRAHRRLASSRRRWVCLVRENPFFIFFSFSNTIDKNFNINYFPGTTSSGETGTTIESEEKQRHRELLQETVAVGIMFASKAFVQLLANPIVGPLTHK